MLGLYQQQLNEAGSTKEECSRGYTLTPNPDCMTIDWGRKIS